MPRFEIGDKVRLVGDDWDALGATEVRSGTIHEVSKVDNIMDYVWISTGEDTWEVGRYDYRAELVGGPPNHYTQGMPEGVQVIDVIRAQEGDFLHGNLIKYVLRWKYKDGVKDLKKARDYLNWLIEQEEANV